VLTARNNLANDYAEAGRAGEAIALHQQTLADRERILGPGDPDTMASRNNLAYAYRCAAQPEKAIQLYEQTAGDRERILGSTHRVTLMSLNNLAVAYHMAGRLQEAVPVYERALSVCMEHMPDDPLTDLIQSNLERAVAVRNRLPD
jgi:tetratricopeptide (TPR) repeat protein